MTRNIRLKMSQRMLQFNQKPNTLGLTLYPTELVNVEAMAPGDSFTLIFTLGNGGTLDKIKYCRNKL